MIQTLLKNLSLLILVEGSLLFPLAWYSHKGIYLAISILLMIGGYLVAAYYQKRHISVHKKIWVTGVPLVIIGQLFALWFFSLPLLTVPIGIVFLIAQLWVIQLFRKHILGVHDVCSIKK